MYFFLSFCFTLVPGIVLGRFYGEGMGYGRQNETERECIELFRHCNGIPECRIAIRKLKKKCHKYPKSYCDSEDGLKFCKQEVMDVLFAHGFTEKECFCDTHNPATLRKCFHKHNLAYANSCFGAVRRYIRHEKIQRILALPEALSNDSANATSKIPNSGCKENSDCEKKPKESSGEDNHLSTIQSRIDPAVTEAIFGDDGFHKPPPKKRYKEKWIKNGIKELDVEQKDVEKEIIPTETVDMLPTERVSEQQTTTISQLEALRKKLQKERDEITTQMKYRIVSIVIGSLFIFSIIAGGICLAARRLYKSRMRYKQGKVVNNNRDASTLS